MLIQIVLLFRKKSQFCFVVNAKSRGCCNGPGLNMLLFKGVFLYLFIFILHSRESELYRYILDGKSARAWELPFLRCLDHLSST